jgi:hypothetical protein
LRVVTAYRVYKIDGSGGIMAADWIEARDDDAALEHARDQAGSGSFELWHGGRLVARTSGDGLGGDPR